MLEARIQILGLRRVRLSEQLAEMSQRRNRNRNAHERVYSEFQVVQYALDEVVALWEFAEGRQWLWGPVAQVGER